MTGWGYSLGSFCRGILWRALLVLFLVTPALAKVTGSCVDCHTMHYSQDGGVLSEWGDEGPYEALLTIDCLGCHTGQNVENGKTPFVLTTSLPLDDDSDTLAGGNFYWVSRVDNTRGHNVLGVGGLDSLTAPPGFNGIGTAADGSQPGDGSWPSGQRVTCAGIYGCHGTHDENSMTSAVRGGHHLGSSGAISTPGTSPAGGYRMLVGIEGFEDSDWEFRPTVTEHNQYKGDTGKGDSTISSLCGRCHGNFHTATGTDSPWLRHPVDYDMGSTGTTSEYRGYGGAGHAYRPDTPVASSSVTSVLSVVTFTNDTIVTCISCHRAHGSPNYKILRWDYTGTISTGCAYCHTLKD
jgi:predicted CXXCH cytochrome family protein